ncbi:MAG: histidine phosphatase family protein [Candidatus Parcubacteria bacterium]|nr:histidine phosphatase family protein [Candidatus Parcubacteria bacterium]
MKWPNYLILIRHDVSSYNVLKKEKETDPLYHTFGELFISDPGGEKTKRLALLLWKKYRLDCSDAGTPLIDPKAKQACRTGQQMKKELVLPEALLYNDWRIFQVLHPEQRLLYEQEGMYRYRYPQGESIPDVRDRSLLMMNTIVRDWANKNVMLVCHHLNILALRANLDRLREKEFIRLDKEEKPLNCGVTVYRGHPDLGQDGRLVLEFYNKKYY